MKITKIAATFGEYNMKSVSDALQAMFAPFGSLTQGVAGDILAGAMRQFVDARGENQPGIAAAIIGILWDAETDDFASAEFGRWQVTLRTPSSGTKIRIFRFAGGFGIEADFGAKGSKTRALNILAAARRLGVELAAYSKDGMLGDSYLENALADYR